MAFDSALYEVVLHGTVCIQYGTACLETVTEHLKQACTRTSKQDFENVFNWEKW